MQASVRKRSAGSISWIVGLLVASITMGACLNEYVVVTQNEEDDEQQDTGDCPAKMKIWCDGDCIDPRKHELHCGECFRSCDQAESCVDGSCVADDGRHLSVTTDRRRSVR